MLRTFFMLAILGTSFNTWANYLEDNLRRQNWNGIEVVWLEDNQYPTYTFNVYFQAGAMEDAPGRYGEMEMTLNQLDSGTNRYSQKEIVDALEFYGASHGASVTHEYATYSVGGLVKDMVPTMKMICHLFSDATYPKKEITKTKKRIINAKKNMVTSHGSLASHVFRKVSLKGTGYENPVGGTIKSIGRIQGKHLAAKLNWLNKNVKKRIYISGPSQITAMKDIIINDCKWSAGDYAQKDKEIKKNIKTTDGKLVYLVPVPKANQAQVRVGRYLSKEEAKRDPDLKGFASKFLGGGFTSQLMNELRVKRGLTYSAGAYASAQKNYGRSGVTTFTKNETIVDTLKVIEETLTANSKEIAQHSFEHSQRYVKGSYLFGLESTHAFLNNLIFFDHIGRAYEEIYKYQGNIGTYTPKQLSKEIENTFKWNEQTVLVLGDKKLKKSLEKAGYKVKVLNYKKYL
jgi:zinc protease